MWTFANWYNVNADHTFKTVFKFKSVLENKTVIFGLLNVIPICCLVLWFTAAFSYWAFDTNQLLVRAQIKSWPARGHTVLHPNSPITQGFSDRSRWMCRQSKCNVKQVERKRQCRRWPLLRWNKKIVLFSALAEIRPQMLNPVFAFEPFAFVAKVGQNSLIYFCN